MKNSFRIIAIFLTAFLASSCLDSGSSGDKKGTLDFAFTTWNEEQQTTQNKYAYATTGTTHTVDVVDVRSYKYAIKVSEDEILQGALDSDTNWITVYESEEFIRDSTREFAFKLPPGDYKSIAIVQANELNWVVEFENELIELEGSNDAELNSEGKLHNIFTTDGLYFIDYATGTYDKASNAEKLGTFTIESGKNTYVTTRFNIISLDWTDADDNGQWSDGDTIDNQSLPDGIDTMADFIVEYDD